MRVSTRVAVSAIVSLLALNLIWLYMRRQTAAEAPTSVIVLKLPRSGSSWFTELMNKHAESYISKEIVQSGDMRKFSKVEVEEHLARALKKPTDKLSNSHNFKPTGRFWEDYIMHETRKWLHQLAVVGFTLNPEHCLEIDWGRIIPKEKFGNTKLIIYGRSNIVKTAISAARGEDLKRVCGLANMKKSRSDCVLPDTHAVSLGTLLNRTIAWQHRQDAFYNYIAREPTLSQLPQLLVSYEELLADTKTTMQRVEEFLTNKPPETDSSSLENSENGESSGWIKRSPDDLSLLLHNIHAINHELRHPACASFKKQLNDVSHTTFKREHNARHFQDCFASIS